MSRWGAAIAALVLWQGYTSIKLAEARHELRQAQREIECTPDDASDYCVGADRDGLGDWQGVAR